MPIMPEQLREMEQRVAAAKSRKTGVPLKDALIDDPDAGRMLRQADHDPDAIAAGTEIENLHHEIIKECIRRDWLYVYSNPTKRTRTTLGTPDFIILANLGTTLFIECKTRTGTLSKPQKEFQRKALAGGHLYFLVRSMNRFNQILKLVVPPNDKIQP